MAIQGNSFQITFITAQRGDQVNRILQADAGYRRCFKEAKGLLTVGSENPVDLKMSGRYEAITLVIADGVSVNQARSVAQRLQLRFDASRH